MRISFYFVFIKQIYFKIPSSDLYVLPMCDDKEISH